LNFCNSSMDTQRFISAVSEQFICPICLLVVYDNLDLVISYKLNKF
jgi:hypothetical protein